MTQTPILFLVFKRPEITERCFQAIRAARPAKLYVGADGPRANRAGEAELCQRVREIATAVDWPCEVKTLFRDQNLGCRRAVSGALDWFFEQEPEGIILEDDCLASPLWFRFAEEMLERYRDDERIMCVSASHFHGAAHTPEDSYFFSRFNHCWGWASWRRAWAQYDSDMAAWPVLKESGWLRAIGYGDRFFEDHWRRQFDRVREERGVDSWAYRWTFSCWAQHGLSVLPARNLVMNVGFDGDSTHTGAGSALDGVTPLETLDFPLRHPPRILPDLPADLWTDRHIYGITPWKWLCGRVSDTVRGYSGRG